MWQARITRSLSAPAPIWRPLSILSRRGNAFLSSLPEMRLLFFSIAKGVDSVSTGKEALAMLEATSRTFFIPISRLPDGLREAVASGYLCLRAIDEIEDHPRLENCTKATLLRTISNTLQMRFDANDFAAALAGSRQELPEVTLRLRDWAMLAPPSIAPRVWEATATMASRMAQWAED